MRPARCMTFTAGDFANPAVDLHSQQNDNNFRDCVRVFAEINMIESL